MKKNIYIWCIAVAVLSLTVACSEETENTEMADTLNELSFVVNPTSTRAVVYGSESEFEKESFGIYSWNNSYNTYKVKTAFTTEDATPISYTADQVIDSLTYEGLDDKFKPNVELIPFAKHVNEKVEKRDGQWFPAKSLIWYPTQTRTFLAVYPQPAATLGTEGLTSLTYTYKPGDLAFSYTVPKTASAQQDLMFAYYKGKGTKGVAPLYFTHPLTCVKFKIGKIEGVDQINSITLAGVYESGSCTVRALEGNDDSGKYSGKFYYSYETATAGESNWTPTGSITVTSTGGAVADLTEGNMLGDGYTFALIPQTLTTQSVTLTMNFTYTKGGSQTKNVSATLNTLAWRAGYVNVYTLTYTQDDTSTLKVSPVQSAITGWQTATTENAELYNW